MTLQLGGCLCQKVVFGGKPGANQLGGDRRRRQQRLHLPSFMVAALVVVVMVVHVAPVRAAAAALLGNPATSLLQSLRPQIQSLVIAGRMECHLHPRRLPPSAHVAPAAEDLHATTQQKPRPDAQRGVAFGQFRCMCQGRSAGRECARHMTMVSATVLLQAPSIAHKPPSKAKSDVSPSRVWAAE
mmetsp:Transcript_14180/g.35846  ORF Transcript_14180/g.35846 Transcript_14180/m.35846 type:complete len:185 (+) Transcript_14180:215-769(+)